MKLLSQIAEGTLAAFVYTLAFILGALALCAGIIIGSVFLLIVVIQVMRDKLLKVV